MTIPARRDPAAEALQLAAIRRDEGVYRGYDIFHHHASGKWIYSHTDEYSAGRFAPTAAAARRAVDELLSKETRV